MSDGIDRVYIRYANYDGGDPAKYEQWRKDPRFKDWLVDPNYKLPPEYLKK